MSQFDLNSTGIGVALNKATFGLSILFIFAAFALLVIAAVYGFSPKHRRRFPAGRADREPDPEESADLSRHRPSFTILMMTMLLMLIVSFAFKAATFCVSFDFIVGFWYELSLLVREISTELLFAGLFMFLVYCECAQSNLAGFPKSTSRRFLMFPLVLVSIMAASTITRLALFIVNWVRDRSTWFLLASFVTFQVYMLAYLILTIFFVVTAVRAWQQRKSVPSFPLELSNGHVTNYMLRRISLYICPLLCILMVYEIVYDVLPIFFPVGLEEWILASTVIEGVVQLFVTIIAVTTRLMPRNVYLN